MRGIVVPSAFSTATDCSSRYGIVMSVWHPKYAFDGSSFPFCRNLVLARDYFFRPGCTSGCPPPTRSRCRPSQNAGPSSLRSGSAVFRRCRTALPSRTPSCSFRWQTHRSAASCGDTAGFLLYKYDCPLLFSKFAQSYAVIMPSVSVRQRSR